MSPPWLFWLAVLQTATPAGAVSVWAWAPSGKTISAAAMASASVIDDRAFRRFMPIDTIDLRVSRLRRQLSHLASPRETSGFASPPHDGFAFFACGWLECRPTPRLA